MPEIRVRAAALLVRDDEILLVKHRKKGAEYWLLPGGGVEYGETIESAVCREVLEETGLKIRAGDLLFISESIPPDRHRHVLNLYYRGDITGGQIRIGDDQPLVGVEFVPITEIPHLDLRPPVHREILDCIQNPEVKRRLSLGNRWDS
jgi:8-oxo-dGTP diphosphatase